MAHRTLTSFPNTEGSSALTEYFVAIDGFEREKDCNVDITNGTASLRYTIRPNVEYGLCMSQARRNRVLNENSQRHKLRGPIERMCVTAIDSSVMTVDGPLEK
ncbi:6312_t:CDS:2 [Paraglomus occultum]|uniref:6312_t:CDS:1 n=1 Tax=Paraglomus occultum TaxID=144539 RepID=A0A9N9GNA3_9GLOM|nr:6312_t:CDS:2 [Paraglomus occultum]